MAEGLGISERQYRRYENGESEISWDAFYQLEDFGFDTFYIFFGALKPDYDATTGLETLPEEEYQRIIKVFRKVRDLGISNVDDATLDMLFQAFDYCKRYGEEHRGIKKIRDSAPCLILTSLHEMQTKFTENKNHHLHVN